jgi:hypothetical protein
MIELLVFHGADVKARDRWDETLIFSDLFSNEKQLEILDFALSHGLDINAVNYFGRTALHCAARHSNAPNVQYLCQMGASLDIRDNFECTPLDTAIHWRECEYKCWSGPSPLHTNKELTYEILRDEPSFRENTAAALAFSMGLDPRLGGGSQMRGLDENLVRMILEETGLVKKQVCVKN